jgi:hypothetical protein
VYYEYRDNRFDKRPKKYPKLEDGGMMAKGGSTNSYLNEIGEEAYIKEQYENSVVDGSHSFKNYSLNDFKKDIKNAQNEFPDEDDLNQLISVALVNKMVKDSKNLVTGDYVIISGYGVGSGYGAKGLVKKVLTKNEIEEYGVSEKDKNKKHYLLQLEDNFRGDNDAVFNEDKLSYITLDKIKKDNKKFVDQTTFSAKSVSTEPKTKAKKIIDKYKYLPNRMVDSVTVKNDGKKTTINSKDILDGFYVKKGVKYADGGEVGDFFYDSRKDKPFQVIFEDGAKIGIQYLGADKKPIGKVETITKTDFEYNVKNGAWGKWKQAFADGGEMAMGGEPHRIDEIFADGGSIAQGNNEMLESQLKAVEHHAKELSSIVNKNTEVEAWVVGKIERAATDLSDITHYLDGRKFEDGGKLTNYDRGVVREDMQRFMVIAKTSKDGRDFVEKARTIKNVSPTTSDWFFDRYESFDMFKASDKFVKEVKDGTFDIDEIYADGGGIKGVYEGSVRRINGKDYLINESVLDKNGDIVGWNAYEVVYENKMGEKHINYERTKKNYNQKYFENNVALLGDDVGYEYFSNGGQTKIKKVRTLEEAKKDPRVEDIYFEEEWQKSGSWWLELKEGYICRSMGSGTIHEDTLKEVLDLLNTDVVKESEYADGGHTQGYDDREDERLSMEYGKISGKDFVGSHKQTEHSRRDDARFEERMAKGGKLIGKQKNIDVNKNGKLDAEDFKLLRQKAKSRLKK